MIIDNTHEIQRIFSKIITESEGLDSVSEITTEDDSMDKKIEGLIKWCKTKKPGISDSEAKRWAQNIYNKKHGLSNSNIKDSPLHKYEKELLRKLDKHLFCSGSSGIDWNKRKEQWYLWYNVTRDGDHIYDEVNDSYMSGLTDLEKSFVKDVKEPDGWNEYTKRFYAEYDSNSGDTYRESSDFVLVYLKPSYVEWMFEQTNKSNETDKSDSLTTEDGKEGHRSASNSEYIRKFYDNDFKYALEKIDSHDTREVLIKLCRVIIDVLHWGDCPKLLKKLREEFGKNGDSVDRIILDAFEKELNDEKTKLHKYRIDWHNEDPKYSSHPDKIDVKKMKKPNLPNE